MDVAAEVLRCAAGQREGEGKGAGRGAPQHKLSKQQIASLFSNSFL